MELLFLGTSSGTPTKYRNVSGIAVKESTGKNWYLVDCGEGTQHQLLHTSLSLNSLNGICITHVHGDHCYGLPGLLASAGMGGRKSPLTIVAPIGVKEWFEATQKHTQLYLPYDVKFVSVESLGQLEVGQLQIDAKALSHRVPSFAYRFSEVKFESKLDFEKLTRLGVPKGPLLGQLKAGQNVVFEDRELKSRDFVTDMTHKRKIVICGDNDTPELLTNYCNGVDVLVHEATFTEELAKQVGDVGHSFAKQIADFSNQAGIPNLVLTHFSPRYQDLHGASSSISDIQNEAKSSYQGNLIMARDFLLCTLEKSGVLTTLDAQCR